MNGCGARMQGQLGSYREKDPSVTDDAVSALTKRATELRNNLARVPSWEAELARVERMIAAAEHA